MTGSSESGLDALTTDELRARRAVLQSADDAVSYVRRVAQGRADLVRDALAMSSDDGDPTPVYIRRDLQGELRDVLADRLLGDSARPPRPAEDFSEHPLSTELDELCASNGFNRLDRLAQDEMEGLISKLDEFERRVSEQRKTLFSELDALTEELVTRYRSAQESAE